MDECRVLHELLYFALLDLREHARERQDRVTYQLSDLFHSVVPQMGSVAAGRGSYAEVLTALKQRASERDGCATWLQSHLEMIREKGGDKDG